MVTPLPPGARYPEIFKSELSFRTKKKGWELFRFGETGSYVPRPSEREAIAGAQFQIDSYDQFAKQSIPRLSTNDPAVQAG